MTRRIQTLLLAAAALTLGIAGHAHAVISNPSFEAGLTDWELKGSTTAVGTGLGPAPTHGTLQASPFKPSLTHTIPDLTTDFLGINSDDFAAALGDDDGDLTGSFGSAIKQTFNVATPTDVSFDYAFGRSNNLFPADATVGYPTTVFVTLDGDFWILTDANTASFPNSNAFFRWTNYTTYSGLPTLAPGSHTIGFAIVGSPLDEAFFVDNLTERPGTLPSAVPEPVTAGLGAIALSALALGAARRRRA